LIEIKFNEAINMIDDAIKQLEQLKEALMKASGGDQSRFDNRFYGIDYMKILSGLSKSSIKAEKQVPNKEAIINLLLKEGPLTRRKIHELTHLSDGIVAGTLYHYKKTFLRNEKNGKWYLVGDKKKQK
jgi:hypothetical protein